jgi:hypothetical protein
MTMLIQVVVTHRNQVVVMLEVDKPVHNRRPVLVMGNRVLRLRNNLRNSRCVVAMMAWSRCPTLSNQTHVILLIRLLAA